jgi:hypothetical protein
MSVIRQAARFRLSDARKSSADAKASAAKPSDFISARIASRTDSSSSTIEMSALFNISNPVSPRDATLRATTRHNMESSATPRDYTMGSVDKHFSGAPSLEYKESCPNGRPACSSGQYWVLWRHGTFTPLAGFLPPPAQTPASLSPSFRGGALFSQLVCDLRNGRTFGETVRPLRQVPQQILMDHAPRSARPIRTPARAAACPPCGPSRAKRKPSSFA